MEDPLDEGKAEDIKDDASRRAREAADAAGERMRELNAHARENGNRMGAALDSRRERLAERIEGAATGMMHRAEQGTRIQHEAQRRLAHGMENAADYLHEHPAGDVARDLQSMVRRHPVRSLIIVAVAVFILARMLR